MTPDVFTRAETAAAFVLSQTNLRPQIGLVLGSGLGAFADDLTEAVRIPYADIPTFPRSTAIGHAGQLVIGKSGDVSIAVMQGRVHLYEGYSAAEVAFPTRVLGRIGIRALTLTNAAGGINVEYGQGALVILRDHINLQGLNPLTGANDERLGPRFPDMTYTYAKRYREIALEEAKKQNLVVDYKILLGNAATPQDFNILIMVESKNMAAQDNAREKFDPIARKALGTTDQQQAIQVKRLDIREIMGTKLMREITLK